MTQRDRDRLVVLKKAQKKLITQKQAAAELELTERQVRRLLKELKAEETKRSFTRCAGDRPTEAERTGTAGNSADSVADD